MAPTRAVNETTSIRLYLSGYVQHDDYDNPDFMVVELTDKTIERIKTCAQLCKTHDLFDVNLLNVPLLIHYEDAKAETTPQIDFRYLSVDSKHISVHADFEEGSLNSPIVPLRVLIRDYLASKENGKSFFTYKRDRALDLKSVAHREAECQAKELNALLQAEVSLRTTRQKVRGL